MTLRLDKSNSSTTVALVVFLGVPGLPLSRWENEFGGIGHLLGYEAIWWLLVCAVLLYVRKVERRPLSSIGFVQPRPRDLAIGLAAGIIILAGVAAVFYLLSHTQHADETKHLSQIIATPLWWRVASVVRAAVAEEVIFRGFSIERGRQLLGSLRIASALSWAVFTVEHIPTWGWSHVLIAGFGGLLLTLLYVWRRNIWINILAHLVVDAAAVFLT